LYPFWSALKHSPSQPFGIFWLILVMSLVGILIIGISRVDAQTLQVQKADEDHIPATVYVVGNPLMLQPSPIAFPTFSPTPTQSWESGTPAGVNAVSPDQGLLAFVHAPSGVTAQPYVILTAYVASSNEQVEIRGFENLREFVCTGFPCVLPLEGSSALRFSAYDAYGGKSPEVLARVRVENAQGGYAVYIESVSQFVIFGDSCSNIWKVKDDSGASWAAFPDSPFELNTNKDLYLLAARLIVSGVVDASDCTGGGVTSNKDYATPCGVERARPQMVEWQNQYDFTIWTTALKAGIPPRLLKTLIEYESQFWPGNERFFLDEYGLGQINQLGIDVVLRQDPAYYRSICPFVLSDCSLPYESLDHASQTIVRFAILNSIDSVCPDCEYGIDLEKAARNIPLIAELLKGNCRMTSYLGLTGNPSVGYEDLWKFTLAAYHSGYSCVRDAISTTRKAGGREDWDTVSQNFGCKDAKTYVDGFWGSLLSFDRYQINAGSAISLVQVAPTFLPTPTPIVPPTALPSVAQVLVRVYLDANGNGAPDDIELLDGITVQLALRDGDILSAVTLDGKVTFDMVGYPPGMDIIASLPGLYREALFTLPKEGTVQIDFVFESPNIPQELP
jgi:hypothetical protein